VRPQRKLRCLAAVGRILFACCVASCGLGLSLSELRAQPLIFHRGAVNAGSFISPGAPGGAIARGSIFTIFGREIGPATPVQVSQFPLGTSFEGVSIEIVQGGTSVGAIPIFVFAGQINAIMPSDAPLGRVSVRVTYQGVESNPVTATVADHSLGIFTATGGGIGPGIVQNFVSQLEQPINSAQQTAKSGQVVTLWATGLGPISGADGAAPPIGTLPFDVEIFVGGVAVTKILYSGRAPMISGVDQLVFEIPAGTPEGCFVPLRIRVNREFVSNTVTIAVREDGSPCEDEFNPLTSTLLAGGVTGVLDLFRVDVQNDVDVLSPTSLIVDRAGAYFRREAGGPFPFNPALAIPPAGSCTAYAVRGDVLAGAQPPFVPPAGLDAGTLSWTGPEGERTLERGSGNTPDRYATATIGGPEGLGADADEPLFLTPGAYTAAGEGGADVGVIAAEAQVSGGLSWTNRNQLDELARDQPLRFEWTGGSEERTFVSGISVDRPNNASGVFLCVAPAGTTAMDVPSDVLANLPTSSAVIGESRSVLLVGSAPSLVTFMAQGLDMGAVLAGSIETKTVRWSR